MVAPNQDYLDIIMFNVDRRTASAKYINFIVNQTLVKLTDFYLIIYITKNLNRK